MIGCGSVYPAGSLSITSLLNATPLRKKADVILIAPIGVLEPPGSFERKLERYHSPCRLEQTGNRIVSVQTTAGTLALHFIVQGAMM